MSRAGRGAPLPEEVLKTPYLEGAPLFSSEPRLRATKEEAERTPLHLPPSRPHGVGAADSSHAPGWTPELPELPWGPELPSVPVRYLI